MTYDDKVNPLYNFKNCLFTIATMSKNNLLAQTRESYNSQENYSATFSYEYDSDGYPISSRIQMNSERNNSVINKNYEYK